MCISHDGVAGTNKYGKACLSVPVVLLGCVSVCVCVCVSVWPSECFFRLFSISKVQLSSQLDAV